MSSIWQGGVFQADEEAKFPRCRKPARAGQKAAHGFKDRAIVTIGGVRIGITGAITDETPEESSPRI
jgi:2',3'-cyclic-nucleotide 2'-phosphodiesterase (5'-nucleotidase family)